MAKQPGSRQPNQPQPQRQGRVIRAHEQEDEGTRVEGGDILLGVVLLLVIPTAMYIALGAFGMPVGGRTGTSGGMTWEEQLEQRDKLKKRKPPPLTEPEFKERLARAEDLLDRYVPKYREQYQKEEEVIPKYHYQKAAWDCASRAENSLKELFVATDKKAELRPYSQKVQVRLNSISQLKYDLKKERVFLDR